MAYKTIGDSSSAYPSQLGVVSVSAAAAAAESSANAGSGAAAIIQALTGTIHAISVRKRRHS
jgi:hypothetical protein